MARYERDYGQDFGRRFTGGMRSDGWGSEWSSFPGEEGWYGQGYDSGFNRGGRPDNFAGNRYNNNGRGFGAAWGYDRNFQGNPGNQGYRGGGYGQVEQGYDTGGYEQGWRNGRGWGAQRETSQTRASSIMTENPVSVTGDTTIQEVATKMRELDVGIIPVVDSDNDRLRGLITDRDIAIRAVAAGKSGDTKVSDCMTDHVRSVNKNDSVEEVMRVMRDEQVRRVPVTDREGRLVGIIAQADLAVDFAGQNRNREFQVGETLERISEPARPDRLAAHPGTDGDPGTYRL